MGCDSHPFIERRTKNGTWKLINSKNHYYNAIYGKKTRELEAAAATAEDREKIRSEVEADYAANYGRAIQVLSERNYSMFAVLSNVRNRGIYPLSFANNGLPNDASERVAKNCSEDSDLHSHTHFTLADLMAVDPTEIAEANGSVLLFADQYVAYKETGKISDDADDYCYDHHEASRKVTEEEMTMLLMSNDVTKLVEWTTFKGHKRRRGPHVEVKAPRSYKSIAPQLFNIVIPELQKLGEPDEIRVVIAYDN